MKRYLLALLATGCVAAIGGSTRLAADDAISITVRPAVTTAHGGAQLKVLIARNELNRSLSWEVDGPSFYRSSVLELAGAASPRSWVFFVRDLPEGEYGIRATVRRSNNSQAVALSRIRVLAGAP